MFAQTVSRYSSRLASAAAPRLVGRVSLAASSVVSAASTPLYRSTQHHFSGAATATATTPAPGQPFYGSDIFNKSKSTDIFRHVEFPVGSVDEKNANAEFRACVNELFVRYKPSHHTFWTTVANAPSAVMRDPVFLNELYFRYQAAMHSTRAAVYFAPHLNSPRLRQRRIAIIMDDDNLDHDSHHTQLEKLFRAMGAEPRHEDEFGDFEPLAAKLDTQTAGFVRLVDQIYRQSTGAWCIAEVLSDDWLSAFAKSLSVHFPFALKAQYFDEILTGHVEVIHMLETVSLTEDVLARYPAMVKPTIQHAHQMAAALNGLWDNLEALLKQHIAAHNAKK